MHLVFDGYWWESGPPSLRHVLRETVQSWAACFPEDEITLVVRKRDVAAVEREVGPRMRVLGSGLWPQAAFALNCGRLRRRLRADVSFVHNFAPPGAGSVVFLHDVLFLTDPGWFTGVERAYFRAMAWLAPGARVVLTSSGSEAARIREHTAARQVRPVGIGLSRELVGATAHRPDLDVEPGRFLLTVGRLNVRKNLAVTVEAALRSGVVSPECPLVVVGGADGKGEALSEAASAAVAAGAVVFAGHVSDGELVWLYRHTSLFLFMSRGEGFGMPVAEAAYFGAPTILSDLPVFREVAMPGTVFCGPDDVDGLARLIRGRAVPARTPHAVEPAVAARYDWDRVVRAMRDAVVTEVPVRCDA